MASKKIWGTFWEWHERVEGKKEPYKPKFIAKALGINESSLRRIREGEIRIPHWLRLRIDDLFEGGEGQNPFDHMPTITEVPIEALPANLEVEFAEKRAKLKAEQAERMKEVRKFSPIGHRKTNETADTVQIGAGQLSFGETSNQITGAIRVGDAALRTHETGLHEGLHEASPKPPIVQPESDMTVHLLTKILASQASAAGSLLNAVHANGNIAEAQQDDLKRALDRIANIGEDIVDQLEGLREVVIALAKGRPVPQPSANGAEAKPDVTYHADGSRTIHQHEAEVTEQQSSYQER